MHLDNLLSTMLSVCLELNKMPCRPPRQRVLISQSTLQSYTQSLTANTPAADDADVSLPSITTDVDLSDHPLGRYCSEGWSQG